MTTLIAEIILVISFLGIGTIVLRKIPVLTELPETSPKFSLKTKFIKAKEKIKGLKYLRSISFEVFLQKALSKIRILTLKIESKTAHWLQKLREKAKKKNLGNDNYWQELKKSKDQKDKQE